MGRTKDERKSHWAHGLLGLGPGGHEVAPEGLPMRSKVRREKEGRVCSFPLSQDTSSDVLGWVWSSVCFLSERNHPPRWRRVTEITEKNSDPDASCLVRREHAHRTPYG